MSACIDRCEQAPFATIRKRHTSVQVFTGRAKPRGSVTSAAGRGRKQGQGLSLTVTATIQCIASLRRSHVSTLGQSKTRYETLSRSTPSTVYMTRRQPDRSEDGHMAGERDSCCLLDYPLPAEDALTHVRVVAPLRLSTGRAGMLLGRKILTRRTGGNDLSPEPRSAVSPQWMVRMTL